MTTRALALAETTEEMVLEGKALVATAEEFRVSDDRSFREAAERRREIKVYRRRVEALMTPIVEAGHQAWQTALRQKKLMLAPADEADVLWQREMDGYEARQREARLAAEGAALAQVRAAQDEARAAAALEAEERGDAAGVHAALEGPPPLVMVPAVSVGDAPEAEGVRYREHYSAEVTDLAALLEAARTDPARYGMFVMANEPALNAAARKLKDAMQVPGVRVVVTRKSSVWG